MLDVGLRQSGYDVTTAGDGVEALETIEWDAPDLVVTDTHLPVLDGFALVQTLKRHPELTAVPVVFLASKPSKAEEKRAIDLGAEGYLPQPVYVRDLAARIRLLLANRARELADAQLFSAPAGLGRLNGSTRDLALADLLQDLYRARATGVVRLRRGAHEAHFFFRDGNVVDAQLGHVRGEEVIYRALLWEDASFDVKLKPVLNEDVIHCTTQTLVTKGMELVDEWLRLCACAEPLAAILDVTPPQLLTRLSALGEMPERLKMMALPPAPRDWHPKLPKAAPIVARPTASSPLRASEAAHQIAGPDLSTTTITGSGTNLRARIVPGDVILPPPDAEEVEPPAAPEPRASPSSAPWTREAHPGGEPVADADVHAAGVPRAWGKGTKLVGGAVVGIAALLGILVSLHSMRDRRMREAEQARGASAVAVAAVPSVVGSPAKPAALPPAEGAPREAFNLAKPLAEASAGANGAPEAPAPAASPATPPKDVGAAASPPAIASRPAVREMFLDSRLASDSRSPLVRDAQRLLLKGDTAHAAEVAQKAVSSNPVDADAWLTLAAARLASGDTSGAAEAYSACVAQAQTVGVTHCRAFAQRLQQ
jgi:CheY-like chemotaxis protein